MKRIAILLLVFTSFAFAKGGSGGGSRGGSFGGSRGGSYSAPRSTGSGFGGILKQSRMTNGIDDTIL